MVLLLSKFKLFKIGETYIKFDFEYSEVNKARVTEAYILEIGRISREFFKKNEYVKVSIEYNEGSLKTRIVVWATALYMGVANYGSFRAGIREIISDSRAFSGFVIDKIDDGPTIHNDAIIRTEKRPGMPGRILDVYKRIDQFERNNNVIAAQRQVELTSIKQEISNLIEVLSNQDRQRFLADLEQVYSRGLPLPNERRTHYLMSRYALKPEDEIEFIEP